VKIQDSVFVEKLSIAARIGCSQEERAYPQRLAVSLIVDCSLAEVEKLEDSVCYYQLRKIVIALADSQEWVLVEHFAEAISEEVLKKFEVASAVQIKIDKFVFSDCDSTGVKIRRERNS